MNNGGWKLAKTGCTIKDVCHLGVVLSSHNSEII